MTGYKIVSILLNSVFLVPLLQPWVSFSIPSVNVPVSQDCSLDQGSWPVLLWSCFWVDDAQGKYFFHSLAPGCLASSLFCKHLFIVNQICEQGRLD